MRDLLDGTGYNRLVKARHGYTLYSSNDTVVGRSIEHYGEYFESEVKVFRGMVNPGDVVIDAGANIGTHALALARLVGPAGRVIAVEPQRLTFQILCANAALNSLENLLCVHGALSDQAGIMEVGDPSLSQPNNFGGISLAALPGNTRVHVLKLDDYFAHDKLRFIKIDVEGMEANVLRGARKIIAKFRPALYVENDRVEKSEELLLLLDELGYSSYWHLPLFHNVHNFFGAERRIHDEGFIDRGDRLECIGFAINLLCIPKEAPAQITGLRPALDPVEHPFKRAYNPLFRISS